MIALMKKIVDMMKELHIMIAEVELEMRIFISEMKIRKVFSGKTKVLMVEAIIKVKVVMIEKSEVLAGMV
jgi:hypothetical protein